MTSEAGDADKRGHRSSEPAPPAVEDGLRWRATFLDSGTWIGGETLMRLACDAGVVVVRTDDEGNPLDVGRRRRTIPPAVRRALMLRDQGRCCYPGCDNQVVDGHHVEHWAHGGTTKLDNVAGLCHRHHIEVHEGGVRVEADGKGAFRFFDRWGQEIVTAPTPPALRGPGHEVIRQDNQAAGVAISADTSLPHWHGEPLDLVATVNGLLSHREARHAAPAPAMPRLRQPARPPAAGDPSMPRARRPGPSPAADIDR